MSNTQSAAAGRVKALLDANSFVEIGAGVKARSTDFGLSAKAEPGDGVITGYGTVEGKLVYVYSQDAAVLGGSIGEMHARKIGRIYELARKMGAPVVGFLDSTGVRIEESVDALDALGSIYNALVTGSGLIPQIAVVAGSCGGGLAFIPALSDFVFMTDKAALSVNSPDAVEGSSKDVLDVSAPAYQAEQGNIDVCGSEEEVLAGVRELLSFLPSNNEDGAEEIPCNDDLNRSTGALSSLTNDAAELVKVVADNGIFFETKKTYGKNMVTGFVRLAGATVGVVANRGVKEVICGTCAKKAADFIRFCDAFDIPVLTFANVAGFARHERNENLLPKAAARLLSAYTNATVPKVTVVTKKALGSASILMGSRAAGADVVLSWPDATIGAMDPKAAGKILAAGQDAAAMRKASEAYGALQANVAAASARGFVDTVIDEADTRKFVIGALEMLYSKREERPAKKHGTI